MTIDEAINNIKSDIKYNKSIGCDISYEEQLAEWLEELVMLRLDRCMIHMPERLHLVENGYRKGIDDFAEKLLSQQVVDKSVVRRIKEQLKGGSSDGNIQ